MPGIVTYRQVAETLAKGFWSRLMGHIFNAKKPNVTRVMELAAGPPTNNPVTLGVGEELLAMGRQANRAALAWQENQPLWDGLVPQIPRATAPNIMGGDPGQYEYGLIIGGESRGGPEGTKDTPIVFSSHKLMSYQETLERLVQYETFCRGNPNCTDVVMGHVQEALDQWTHGNQSHILPMWVYEYVTTDRYAP